MSCGPAMPRPRRTDTGTTAGNAREGGGGGGESQPGLHAVSRLRSRVSWSAQHYGTASSDPTDGEFEIAHVPPACQEKSRSPSREEEIEVIGIVGLRMYADRMGIVAEIGCPIARGQRERGASYTKYTCGCGRRTRRVRRPSRRFWSVRQTTDERSRGGEERTNERTTNEQVPQRRFRKRIHDRSR